jgi:hypothetical protein
MFPDVSKERITHIAKVKVKFILEQATKAQRGSRGISLLFNLGARWRWVVNATPRPLYPRERDWRLGGPQGRYGRVRKISPPTGTRSPDRPAGIESLYRLRYPGPTLSPFYVRPESPKALLWKRQPRKVTTNHLFSEKFRNLKNIGKYAGRGEG